MTSELSDDVGEQVEEHPCVNHSGTLTAVACGKCGTYICPKCMVFTPVGVRCRECAQLKKLPQFDVRPSYLALSGAIGFTVSTISWFVGLHVYFFAWFIAIGIGLAVGEVASRLARRRVNRWLEIVVGVDIVAGFLLARYLEFLSFPGVGLTKGGALFLTVLALNSPFDLLMLALAIFFALTRLHR